MIVSSFLHSPLRFSPFEIPFPYHPLVRSTWVGFIRFLLSVQRAEDRYGEQIQDFTFSAIRFTASESFLLSSWQYQLLVIKVWLAKGVKERRLQKGEYSRGTPLVVSTFWLTKVETLMKHGSGHESRTSPLIRPKRRCRFHWFRLLYKIDRLYKKHLPVFEWGYAINLL